MLQKYLYAALSTLFGTCFVLQPTVAESQTQIKKSAFLLSTEELKAQPQNKLNKSLTFGVSSSKPTLQTFSALLPNQPRTARHSLVPFSSSGNSSPPTLLISQAFGTIEYLNSPNWNWNTVSTYEGALPIPSTAVYLRPARTEKGVIIGQDTKAIWPNNSTSFGALHASTVKMRLMQPTAQYPDGYVVYMNNLEQTINPWTGQTIPPADRWWHIPICPNNCVT